MDKVTEWSSILFSRNLELAVGGGRRGAPGHARRHTPLSTPTQCARLDVLSTGTGGVVLSKSCR